MKAQDIKFKAWDPVSEQMHVPMSLSQIKAVLVAGTMGESGAMGVVFGFTFDKLEFLEFTGLLDKDQKEIFRGDIVGIAYDLREEDWNGDPRKPDGYTIGYVDRDEHSTSWILRCKSDHSVRPDGTVITSLIHGSNGERKLLGNIYQNPELLNKIDHGKEISSKTAFGN